MGLARYVARYLPGLLPRYLPGGGESEPAWTPALWFQSNEQGIWLDQSDFTRYTERGPNLVTNGAGTTSGWTTSSTSISVVDGALRVENTSASYGYAWTPITCEVGKTYLVSRVNRGGNNADAYVSVDGGIGGLTNTSLGSNFTFVATSTTMYVSVWAGSNVAGNYQSYDDIYIGEVNLSTATLFQDANGTTPDTAVEQPNGLALDLRLGAERGPELVSNGTFATSTGWTLPAGWSVGSGVLSFAGGSTNQAAFDADFTLDAYHEITFDVTAISGGAFVVQLAGSTSGFTFSSVSFSTVGTHRVMLRAPASVTGTKQFSFSPTSSGAVFSVDNLSVKAIPGNHVSQATSASRWTLSARKNVLTKTEQFDDAAWSKFGAGVTANQAVAPSGSGADLVVPTVTNEAKVIRQTNVLALHPTTTPTTRYVVKAAGFNRFAIVHGDGGNGAAAVVGFDLAAGTVYSTQLAGAVSASGSINPLGGGWYECVARSVHASAAGDVGFTPLPSAHVLVAGFPTFSGDGTSGCLVADAQTELGRDTATATTYQRVNTATDYDTEGFLHYVKLDGADDGLGATFPAGTLGSDMDCFMLVRRDSAEKFLLGFQTASASPYFGVAQAGDLALADNGAGAPVYVVNGVVVPGNTRADLHAAIPVGAWAVVEVRGLLLIAWTGISFGNYPSYSLNGAIAEVILAPAQDADARTQAREYLAAKAGITLP